MNLIARFFMILYWSLTVVAAVAGYLFLLPAQNGMPSPTADLANGSLGFAMLALSVTVMAWLARRRTTT